MDSVSKHPKEISQTSMIENHMVPPPSEIMQRVYHPPVLTRSLLDNGQLFSIPTPLFAATLFAAPV